MQKYQDSVLSANASGDRPVGGASITVTQFPGGGPATIYSDNGVTPIIQPISTGPDGSFAFYAADGHYNISVSGPGIASRTITDVLLQDSAATLALSTAAATVGSTGPSNVQADLNARPTSATLAASSGSSLMGGTWFGGVVATVAQLATSIGASLIGFIQAGVGAVLRSIQDKLRETVSVTDFYANGVSGVAVDPTGVVDSTLGIQAAFDLLKGVYIPPGTYKISDSIKYRGYGRRIFGAGKELSIINQVTAGKHCIEGGSGQSLYRADISDLGFTGASGTGHAIYFPQLYESEISRITAYCGGSALKLDACFSVKFSRIDASSYDSHGFDVLANNTVLFESCYAHTMNTAGKAGFKVTNEATFIDCNCVDSGDYGFWLSGATSRWNFINCNFEDCKQYGVYSDAGNMIALFDNCYWKPPSAATAPSGYQCSLYVTFSDSPIQLRGCSLVSKGATRLLGQEVVFGSGGSGYSVIGNPGVTALQSFTLAGTTTTAPGETTAVVVSGVFGHKFKALTCDRQYGFSMQNPLTWTANTATFDVTSLTITKTANTGATGLTNATGGIDGQRLTILVKDANTTIKHAVGGAGRFINKSGADIVATNGLVYEYVSNGGIWQQVGP